MEYSGLDGIQPLEQPVNQPQRSHYAGNEFTLRSSPYARPWQNGGLSPPLFTEHANSQVGLNTYPSNGSLEPLNIPNLADISRNSHPLQPIESLDMPKSDFAADQPRPTAPEPLNIKTSPSLKSASSWESLAICDQCGTEQPFVSYCPACSFHFCASHWDCQILHHSGRAVNGVPHEKTDPHLAKRIKSIIEPSISEEEQNRLHREDDDTTWFGVFPNAAGQLLFHDFGRYEEFLSQSTYSPKSRQFPSLISFVGPTGAGKSTVIKALVKLTEVGPHQKKHQTPVVGLVQHQTIPTSSEVHLYWDPSSLVSNRPLIYADCEGLGGGSRKPRAAIATATRDKKTLTKEKKERDGKRAQYDSFSTHNPSYQPSKSYPDRNLNLRQRLSVYSSMSSRNTYMPPTSGLQRPSVSAIDTSSVPASYSPWSAAAEQDESQDGWTSGCEKAYRGVTREIRWAQERERRSRQFIVENLYPRILYTFSDIVILVMRNPKWVTKIYL